MYEVYENLLKENGVTSYKVSKETGISQVTLSNWKKGVSTPKQDKLQKIADFFGVTIDYLMNGSNNTKESTLTNRDVRQIEDVIEETKKTLLSQQGLMFEGGTPVSKEAIASIVNSMELGMEMAKKKNKEKYTPKKYKKD